MDYTLGYNHVLYCVNSETPGGLKWYTYWANFIREKASLQNKRVYIGKTWDNLGKEGKKLIEISDPANTIDFFDISEIYNDRDQTIWNKFVFARNYFENYPRPINMTGTSAAGGNNFVDNDQDGIGRFWRNLIGGSAAIQFQTPDSRSGLNVKAISCIKTARKIETMVQFWSLKPYNNLLSELIENTSYVSADIGRSYVVYIPSGGEATLDVSDAENPLELFWFEIDPAVMGKRNAQFPEFVSRQSQLRLKPPGQGNWVAVLLRKDRTD